MQLLLRPVHDGFGRRRIFGGRDFLIEFQPLPDAGQRRQIIFQCRLNLGIQDTGPGDQLDNPALGLFQMAQGPGCGGRGHFFKITFKRALKLKDRPL